MAANSITLSIRPKWPDIADDYLVWYEGREIGRMRLVRDAKSPSTAWEWYICVPMAVPEWGKGATGSRDTAIRDFGTAWGRFLKETRPGHLQRAWDLQSAAQSRVSGIGVSNVVP